jgi:hypothetical protein
MNDLINFLPPELWINVFKYVDINDLVQLFETCQYFKELINGYELFWKSLNFKNLNWNQIVNFVNSKHSVKEVVFPLNESSTFEKEWLVLEQMPDLECFFMMKKNVWIDLDNPYNHLLYCCKNLKQLHLTLPYDTVVDFFLLDMNLIHLEVLHLSNLQKFIFTSNFSIVCHSFLCLKELRLEFDRLKEYLPCIGPNLEILYVKNCYINSANFIPVYSKLVDVKILNCILSNTVFGLYSFKTIISFFINTLKILHVHFSIMNYSFLNEFLYYPTFFEFLKDTHLKDLRFVYYNNENYPNNTIRNKHVYHILKNDDGHWFFDEMSKKVSHCVNCAGKNLF